MPNQIEATIPTVAYGNLKVSADTAEGFAALGAAVIANDVIGVTHELCAISAVTAGGGSQIALQPAAPVATAPQTPPPVQPAAPVDPSGFNPIWGGAPQPAAPAAPVAPAPPAVATPWPDAPVCPHGPMVHRQGVTKSGPNQGKPWQGYFCPSPKGTPGQCEAQFIR